MGKLNKEFVKVQCTRPDPLPDGTICRYQWETRSPLLTVSCPNCRYPNNKQKAIAARVEADAATHDRTSSVVHEEKPAGGDNNGAATE